MNPFAIFPGSFAPNQKRVDDSSCTSVFFRMGAKRSMGMVGGRRSLCVDSQAPLKKQVFFLAFSVFSVFYRFFEAEWVCEDYADGNGCRYVGTFWRELARLQESGYCECSRRGNDSMAIGARRVGRKRFKQVKPLALFLAM